MDSPEPIDDNHSERRGDVCLYLIHIVRLYRIDHFLLLIMRRGGMVKEEWVSKRKCVYTFIKRDDMTCEHTYLLIVVTIDRVDFIKTELWIRDIISHWKCLLTLQHHHVLHLLLIFKHGCCYITVNCLLFCLFFYRMF